MNLGIADRVALVTGAGSGIGRAVVQALVEEGVRVALCGRNPDRLEAARRELRTGGDRVHAVPADLTVDGASAGVVDEVVATFGSLDMLVNAAGQTSVCGTLDVPRATWDAILDSLFFSAVGLCEAAVPHMRHGAWGRIVNVASNTVKSPSGSAPYDVAKAALVAFTKDLASELAPDGITVNAVCPGSTLTPMWTGPGAIGDQLAGAFGVELDALLGEVAAKIPVRRMADPAEVADVVAFLLSERAGYITGTSIYVDGGAVSTPF